MMRCPKCQGCVVFDGEERRCVNCGHRPDLIVRVIEPEPDVLRCTYNRSCDEPRVLGRLMCRPHLRHCVERAKAYQARMREQRATVGK